MATNVSKSLFVPFFMVFCFCKTFNMYYKNLVICRKFPSAEQKKKSGNLSFPLFKLRKRIEEQNYSSTVLYPRHWMKVRSLITSPRCFTLGKWPRYPFHRWLNALPDLTVWQERSLAAAGSPKHVPTELTGLFDLAAFNVEWLGWKVKECLYRSGKPLRIPGVWNSQISRQSTHKVVSCTHRLPLPPRKYSWYSFLFKAESTPEP